MFHLKMRTRLRSESSPLWLAAARKRCTKGAKPQDQARKTQPLAAASSTQNFELALFALA